MSSTEFVDWMGFLEMEPNMFHREDYYWARMIQLLQAQLVKNPNSIRLEDCLLRFTKEKKRTWRNKASSAQSFFGRLLGAKKAADNKRGP